MKTATPDSDEHIQLSKPEKRRIAAALCSSIARENFQPFWLEHLAWSKDKMRIRKEANQ
jgi:hypothetical protein